MVINNIFSNIIPPQGAEETFEHLLRNDNLLIERIISSGQVTPEGKWYDSDQTEWVLLLQGQASIQMADGTTTELNPGDYILIPAHRKHRVTYTSQNPPCIWLTIYFK